jgi:predicted ribosome quality control (RQC) complex YloA/Tae2 family protein
VDGYQLLVGESAEANDYLVTRVASPSDLWFHVHGAAGAHGILRTQGQPSRVPDTIIRRAAEIVAARSGKGEKHAEIVPVDVTEKRYVRKPRGAKPGQVTYERARCLDISPRL